MQVNILSLLFWAIVAAATPRFVPIVFGNVNSKRQLSANSSSSGSNDLVVDLGYEIYQGVSNKTTGLNDFWGVRYAAPPIGNMRWQPPQVPAMNREKVLQADTLAQNCPQSQNAPGTPDFNFTGNEDCLFVNIYAPPNAKDLPVLVWVHGGGYGLGQGNEDLSAIINANNNSLIGVAIQYRLGAFGFLSSNEVKRFGTVNAGLLDQSFALQWAQTYIGLFGGNASRVTLAGESAGGGSVIQHTLAFGGSLGDSLFTNAVAASPFLPQQYGYADFVPSQSYYAFAAAAGCFGPPARAQNNVSNSIFECLVGRSTEVLQNASNIISSSSRYGTWAFLPVTDGTFLQQTPSQQLLKNQVNGRRLLVGNNADEGPLFTPQTIKTEADVVDFIRNTFPLFTEDDISKVLFYYPSNDAPMDQNSLKFGTLGNSTPTALNESTYGTGQQQRVNDIYAETTFVCPSYWLAEAFASLPKVSYRYQYSVIPAQHGTDLTGYFGPKTPYQGPDFETAFMRIWGDFITDDNPSIPASIANGANFNVTLNSPATNWPAFSLAEPYQLDLNQTGGVPHSIKSPIPSIEGNITILEEPGLRNDFRLVNAYTWEGGRGTRCVFLAKCLQRRARVSGE